MRFALLLAISFVFGCSSTPPSVRLLLEFSVSPRGNHNSPVPVSLVAVTDPKLLESISQMSAKEWFKQREQLHRDHPGGQAFSEWLWEYVPGQNPPPVVIEVDGSAVAAFIFANYRTSGDHRFRLGPQQRIRLELGDESFSVTTLDTGSE